MLSFCSDLVSCLNCVWTVFHVVVCSLSGRVTGRLKDVALCCTSGVNLTDSLLLMPAFLRLQSSSTVTDRILDKECMKLQLSYASKGGINFCDQDIEIRIVLFSYTDKLVWNGFCAWQKPVFSGKRLLSKGSKIPGIQVQVPALKGTCLQRTEVGLCFVNFETRFSFYNFTVCPGNYDWVQEKHVWTNLAPSACNEVLPSENRGFAWKLHWSIKIGNSI